MMDIRVFMAFGFIIYGFASLFWFLYLSDDHDVAHAVVKALLWPLFFIKATLRGLFKTINDLLYEGWS